MVNFPLLQIVSNRRFYIIVNLIGGMSADSGPNWLAPAPSSQRFTLPSPHQTNAPRGLRPSMNRRPTSAWKCWVGPTPRPPVVAGGPAQPTRRPPPPGSPSPLPAPPPPQQPQPRLLRVRARCVCVRARVRACLQRTWRARERLGRKMMPCHPLV